MITMDDLEHAHGRDEPVQFDGESETYLIVDVADCDISRCDITAMGGQCAGVLYLEHADQPGRRAFRHVPAAGQIKAVTS